MTCSRCREYEKSLDALESAQAGPIPGVLLPEVVAEILTRPFWDGTLDTLRFRSLETRIHANQGPRRADPPFATLLVEYFERMRRNQREEAAGLFERGYPLHLAFYNLVPVWHARAAGNWKKVESTAKVARHRTLAHPAGAWAFPEIRRLLEEARSR